METQFEDSFSQALSTGVQWLESQSPADGQESLLKFGRKLMKFSLDIAGLEVLVDGDVARDINGPDVSTEVSFQRQKKGERKRFTKISDFTSIFLTYMVPKLLICFYLQNKFDIACFKLKSIAIACVENGVDLACYSKEILERPRINCSAVHAHSSRNKEIEWEGLHQEYLFSASWLKTIGDPWLYIGFCVECSYIFLLVLNICGYFIGRRVPWDYKGMAFASLKAYALEKNERIEILEATKKIVNSYTSSSHTFLEIIKARHQLTKSILRFNGTKFDPSKSINNPSHRFVRKEVQKKILDHETSLSELAHMASDGRLHPLNMRPETIRSNAARYVKYLIGSIALLNAFTISYTFAFFSIIPSVKGHKLDYVKLQDFVFFLEYSLLLTIDTVLASVYLILPLMICLDQISYADGLINMVNDCQQKVGAFRKYNLDAIEMLKMKSYSKLAPRKAAHLTRASMAGGLVTESHELMLPMSRHGSFERVAFSRNSERMEIDLVLAKMKLDVRSSLLVTLMQYKLFAEQFKHVRGILSIAAVLAFIVVTAVPVAVQLYYSYLDPSIRGMVAGCAIGFTLCINGSFLPSCELHKRCIKLTQKMTCLLANAVEAFCIDRETILLRTDLSSDSGSTSPEVSAGAPKIKLFYSNSEDHTIWLLRKELNDIGKISSRFTVKISRIKLTYGTMIKLYFWLGVLVVPSLMPNSQEGQISDRLMRFV